MTCSNQNEDPELEELNTHGSNCWKQLLQADNLAVRVVLRWKLPRIPREPITESGIVVLLKFLKHPPFSMKLVTFKMIYDSSVHDKEPGLFTEACSHALPVTKQRIKNVLLPLTKR